MLGSQSVSDADDAAWDAVEEGGFLDGERGGRTLSEEGWVISAIRDAETLLRELDDEGSSTVVKHTASEEKYSGEEGVSSARLFKYGLALAMITVLLFDFNPDWNAFINV